MTVVSQKRYQIFVPAVHDVDCKFITPEKLSVQFTSKDKNFLAEHSQGSNEYFCVNLKMSEDAIDKEKIAIRGVRRKTFEVEVTYLKGMGISTLYENKGKIITVVGKKVA